MNDNGEPFWRRNLTVIWISQFITYLGFTMAMPFTPFYMRECLGVADEGMLKMYTGMASSLPALSLAIMSPVWGILADRFGRKMMMLRANYAGGIIIALMGFAPQLGAFFASIGLTGFKPIYVFLGLRLLQGMFTGTTSAAMTLISSCAPRNRQGYALAIMSSAYFSGDIAGSVIGGYLASVIGYQNSFYVGGLMWVLAGIMVMFMITEHFQPKSKADIKNSAVPFHESKFFKVFVPGIPLFALFVFSNMARFIDNSQFPLVIEQLNGGHDFPFAERWTSLVLAIGFVGAMTAGFTLGRFIDKHAKLVSVLCCAGTGIFMASILLLQPILGNMARVSINVWGIPNDASTSVIAMFPLRYIMIFFSAGLEPVWNSWLSKITPQDSKGLMFGSAVTFRSIGQIFAHSSAAWLSMRWGFHSIYIAGPLLFFLLIPLVLYIERKIKERIS